MHDFALRALCHVRCKKLVLMSHRISHLRVFLDFSRCCNPSHPLASIYLFRQRGEGSIDNLCLAEFHKKVHIHHASSCRSHEANEAHLKEQTYAAVHALASVLSTNHDHGFAKIISNQTLPCQWQTLLSSHQSGCKMASIMPAISTEHLRPSLNLLHSSGLLANAPIVRCSSAFASNSSAYFACSSASFRNSIALNCSISKLTMPRCMWYNHSCRDLQLPRAPKVPPKPAMQCLRLTNFAKRAASAEDGTTRQSPSEIDCSPRTFGLQPSSTFTQFIGSTLLASSAVLSCRSRKATLHEWRPAAFHWSLTIGAWTFRDSLWFLGASKTDLPPWRDQRLFARTPSKDAQSTIVHTCGFLLACIACALVRGGRLPCHRYWISVEGASITMSKFQLTECLLVQLNLDCSHCNFSPGKWFNAFFRRATGLWEEHLMANTWADMPDDFVQEEVLAGCTWAD